MTDSRHAPARPEAPASDETVAPARAGAALPPAAAERAAALDLTSDHLPCGRSTEDLLDLVLDGRAAPLADERDDHQRTCVHCRALAAEADRLWEPVRASAATVETPPPDLLEAVMASVRALGHDPEHLVIPGARGATRIDADTLRRITEHEAGAVPGVALALARRARTCRGAHTGTGGPGHLNRSGDVGIAGQRVVLDLAVVTVYGMPIPAVAAQVRDRVRAALAAITTATETHVDIYVDDITTD